MTPDMNDPFRPPMNPPVQVRCIHCDQIYMSDEMVYEKRFRAPYALWWCKHPRCDGAGYGFDIQRVCP